MQIPDAVYHLMRHTELKRCDLSGNVITKIPPKFAVKFSLITGKNDKLHQIIRNYNFIFYFSSLQFFFFWNRKLFNNTRVACRTEFESQSNEQIARGVSRAASSGETRHFAQHFHRSTTCRLANTAAQATPRQQQFYHRFVSKPIQCYYVRSLPNLTNDSNN